MRLGGLLSKGRVLAVLMTASGAAALLGPAAAGPARKLARLVIAPPGEGGMYAVTAVARHVDRAMQDTISQDEARRLRAENAYLRNVVGGMVDELARTREEIAAIQHIRNYLYGRTDEMPSELIRSRVVALDSLPYSNTRVVSTGHESDARPGNLVTTRELWTGRRAGLPKKLAVITASALVGRITESDTFTARLQLLTDRSFRIAVQVHRVVQDPERPRKITVTTDGGPDRAERLTPYHPNVRDIHAAGDGGHGMLIQRVDRRHEVRAGDVVLTRGDERAIGAPVPVGRVERVADDEEAPAMFVTLHVRPYANLASLRQVYIIVPPWAGRAGPKGEAP